jgi:hypothetical protein
LGRGFSDTRGSSEERSLPQATGWGGAVSALALRPAALDLEGPERTISRKTPVAASPRRSDRRCCRIQRGDRRGRCGAVLERVICQTSTQRCFGCTARAPVRALGWISVRGCGTRGAGVTGGVVGSRPREPPGFGARGWRLVRVGAGGLHRTPCPRIAAARPRRLARSRTRPFQGRDTGSNPVGVTY